MTYDAREKSVYEGSPIELFEFSRGAGLFWRYTSADEDQLYFGSNYEAVPVKRDKIDLSQNVQTAALTVTLPLSADFVEQYIEAPPAEPIGFVLRRFHDQDAEVASIWIGRVVNVEFMENAVEVLCESVFTSLKRPTLRRLYQVSCPHVLYSIGDGKCNVAAASFLVAATLSGVSGLVLTSTAYGAYADDYFTGGYVELFASGATSRRFITDHTGNDITIQLALPGAAAGVVVDTYPGCAHNLADCNLKFGNILNYGGTPWIPVKNPMGGAPIF